MIEPNNRGKVTPRGLLEVWAVFVAIALSAGAIAIALGLVSVPAAQQRNITIVAVMACVAAFAGRTKRTGR